jgi:hypothetical protein
VAKRFREFLTSEIEAQKQTWVAHPLGFKGADFDF